MMDDEDPNSSRLSSKLLARVHRKLLY